jgi:phenylpropionate dioxygenase-like ring-hydroxylating dioxygenase large terminal subunit
MKGMRWRHMGPRIDCYEVWYPLYLTKDVPEDAVLPLTMYYRQLVLCRDGNDVLLCHGCDRIAWGPR